MILKVFIAKRIQLQSEYHLASVIFTEIRAWNLSGECDLWRNWWAFLGDDMIDRKQKCIKENALLSMRSSERTTIASVVSKNNDKQDHAKNEKKNLKNEQKNEGQIEEGLFRKCFDDHWPFTAKAHLDTSWRKPPRMANS